MDNSKKSIRVLLFPWLAHGHISPFLQLAKALSRRNFFIYLCSSPINLDSIRKKLSEKDSISIKLVELRLPASPELPPHYHTTNGLPPHLMPTLKEALDITQPQFSTILETISPDLVIYDIMQPWAPAEAALRNIPAVLFLSSSGASSSYIFRGWFAPSSEYPIPAIYLREHEHNGFSRISESSASNMKDWIRVKLCIERSSDIVLIKTSRKLEGKYVDYLSVLIQKRFVPVGPLVESAIGETKHNSVIEWLERKNPNSTVFASFGTEYFLSREEIEEIALGLELSKVNFIWVLRFHSGERFELDKVLPKGFLERVQDRGIVMENWAPQGRILAHPSIGGFVSHCGWSSIIEGIFFQVPIIAVPMHLDQPLNARLVEDARIGEEVVRNKEGKLDRGEVGKVIRKVVLGKSGEEMRKRVGQLSEKLREKGEEEIDRVVEEIVKLCRKTESWKLSPANSMNKLHLTISNQESVLNTNT